MRKLVITVSVLALVVAAVIVARGGADTDADSAVPTSVASSPQAGTQSSATTTPPGAAGGVPKLLASLTKDWLIDWTTRSIDLNELIIGIRVPNPRDRIPPIDKPVFDDVAAGDEWLDDREPGLLLQGDGEARFYPLSILTRHEIVNDEIDGRPIAVTFCPLCNTAIVFDRTVDGTVLRLGTSGLLRNSDLVMWDDATQSLWQQITGEAIVGSMTGKRLPFLPGSLVAWSDFKSGFPDGLVLSRNLGFGIEYGLNPYVGYTSSARPFLFNGEIDARYPALERMVGVIVDDAAKAYPFSRISEVGAVNDVVGGVPIVVFWGSPATADALDGPVIAESQAVGTGVAYASTVDGTVLTFSPAGEGFTDAETGSTWTILGKATDGPLAGTSLDPVVHRNEFWFAWQAFFPDAPVYGE